MQPLVEDIREHGLKNPLICSLQSGAKPFKLENGFRRVAALRQLNSETATIVIGKYY